MTLSELLGALPSALAARDVVGDDTIVRGMAYDSRQVAAGDLFVALVGHDADGHAYVDAASRAGAVALLVENPEILAQAGLPGAVVPDTRRALAFLATHFFGHPARETTLVGVSGTNGKTSTTFLLESILGVAGIASGVIGTVEIRYADERIRAVNTTPESLDLQRTLRQMVTRGIEVVAMEVSSHGLALGRVEGCQFAIGAVTNLTQDHLDFHEDMEAYADAKALLFARHLVRGGHAVINLDDPWAARFRAAAEQADAQVLGVTRDPGRDAEIKVLASTGRTDGTLVHLALPAGELEVDLPLVGDFNVENLAIAAGIAAAYGLPNETIARGVAACPQVPGRAERVAGPSGSPMVIVDYAHTPDAVEKLLATLAPLTKGRLITVFGCGGDRDPTKRAPMAKAVARFSDRALATSDNPRTEDPMRILADVEAGLGEMVRTNEADLDATERGYQVLVDRRDAIARAIAMAGADDTVVLAGKGHEDYQIIGTEKLPFDDREIARRLLAERGGGVTEPFTLDEAAAWTGGRLVAQESGSQVLGAVSTDTRTLSTGSLFVAIRGPRHDAHDHLASAVENGAAALLVERTTPATAKVPTLVVDDTTRALGALAAGHRRRFDGPVIAITGSNGKTTTKEMCASILAVSGPCLKNQGNLNNEYGLPLTLLAREAEHRALVVEIGMNHRGEIAPLAAIAAPTVGVITNVGTAHIEHLGSQEEIAAEKGDLVAALDASACAVLNADDPRVMAQAERTKARVVRFGRAADADLRAEAVVAEPSGHYRFDLAWGKERHEVSVAGLGAPTVINALAAAAGALAAGSGLPEVVRGLANYGGVEGRMARVELDDGSVVIDDTYNANPQSTEAALRSLARFREGGRAFAALGSMGELGETAPEAHRAMGAIAAELDLTGLLALGEHAEHLAEGARKGGLPADRIFVATDHADLLARLDELRRPGDWILVKGSRSMQMERIVRSLAEGKES